MGAGICAPPGGAAIAAFARKESPVKHFEKCPYCSQSNWIQKSHGNVCWSCGYAAPKAQLDDVRHDDGLDALSYALQFQARQSQQLMNGLWQQRPSDSQLYAQQRAAALNNQMLNREQTANRPFNWLTLTL